MSVVSVKCNLIYNNVQNSILQTMYVRTASGSLRLILIAEIIWPKWPRMRSMVA